MKHNPFEKLIDPQLKKVPSFYGTLRFIAAFTTVHHVVII
jgi:hypothetical protein